ncbi:hypothetical protein AGLY_017897 [Aphis glycines]|uniref:Uncharacterized protein n=1 Tax=Aphis glycines TaxID=307491 RepID=A0A6G0STI6_APHGL|nr:hypothetical protein AGLY_017897 [Aphis glycines]
MFILSQAIIPVFVFAVMVNFYHFDSIFSTEVFVNFTNCNDCTNSTCYNNNSGPCGVLSDNITVQCYTCSEEDGNQQYYTEEDCKANCSDVTKCYCDGMCYKCVEDNKSFSKLKLYCIIGCTYTIILYYCKNIKHIISLPRIYFVFYFFFFIIINAILSLSSLNFECSKIGDLEITLIPLIRLNNLTIQDLIFSFVFCENTNFYFSNKTTQKILAMIPPESSESSGNESSDKHVDYASNFDSSSSSLSANTDENELDELLKNFELNPIDEATREFFDSIDENIIEEEISTTNFSNNPLHYLKLSLFLQGHQESIKFNICNLNGKVKNNLILELKFQTTNFILIIKNTRNYASKNIQKILRSLHFQNNDEYDPDDRFYKIRPFLNKIRQNCLNQEEGNRYSIDEMMIPYKVTKVLQFCTLEDTIRKTICSSRCSFSQ